MTIAAWRATFTRRWHRHPELCETHDPVSSHQGRVALLTLILFPTSHAVHRAAILHDMGEATVGDVPNPVKERNPDLKQSLDRIEAEELAKLGLPDVSLSPIEQDMLKLCDKLDAILWAHHHRPHLMNHPGWQADIAKVRSLMWRCGIGDSANKILEGLSK